MFVKVRVRIKVRVRMRVKLGLCMVIERASFRKVVLYQILVT